MDKTRLKRDQTVGVFFDVEKSRKMSSKGSQNGGKIEKNRVRDLAASFETNASAPGPPKKLKKAQKWRSKWSQNGSPGVPICSQNEAQAATLEANL